MEVLEVLMLYKVMVEAEITSNLSMERIEAELQFALVSSNGNEIVIDHKCSEKFAVNDYTKFQVEKLLNGCLHCGENKEFRMVDIDGLNLVEREICIDPNCPGNIYE